MEKKVFCPNCGTPLPLNAKFCNKCGTPISNCGKAETHLDSILEDSVDLSSVKKNIGHENDSKEKTLKEELSVQGIIGVFIIGFIIWFVFKNLTSSNDSSESSATTTSSSFASSNNTTSPQYYYGTWSDNLGATTITFKENEEALLVYQVYEAVKKYKVSWSIIPEEGGGVVWNTPNGYTMMKPDGRMYDMNDRGEFSYTGVELKKQ